jgi:predicted RNA polymerase sigma factor
MARSARRLKREQQLKADSTRRTENENIEDDKMQLLNRVAALTLPCRRQYSLPVRVKLGWATNRWIVRAYRGYWVVRLKRAMTAENVTTNLSM